MAVRITRNFESNLQSIRTFSEPRGASAQFDDLLDRLFQTVLPNLERFPELGYDLLKRKSNSVEGLALVRTIEDRLDGSGSIREYISGDYLVLYLLRGDELSLLAIKHHLQLSFDLKSHWLP